MVSTENDFKKFDTLFHPKHIALIGASQNSAFGSMLFLTAFEDSVWSDTFYPVNPKRDKILEWKCYPSVLDVPFPIDTAYISVKTPYIPKVLKECVEKGIQWVIVFSSGFSELGEIDGKVKEQELKDIIKDTNTRIIGPNCLGPFNGENGMSFSFATQGGRAGSVSFMSQSGGHLNQLIDVGMKRDIRFMYGVSFGNQIDLNCKDFTKHYRQHDKTKVIAAYLESFGSANGHDLFMELQETNKIKPVVLWKGGFTEDGSKAAFSHTGAIASDLRLWRAMAKQTGTTLVQDNEEFWNAIKTFELCFPEYMPKSRNVGIITPGGGSSVNMTDLFASYDLNIPELTQETQEKIGEILPIENVNITNPIDLGASGFVIDIYVDCIKYVIADPNIDTIIIPLWPNQVYSYVFKRMIKLQKSTSKPFAFCLPSIADDLIIAKRFQKGKKQLHNERVLYYLTLREAAKSISHLCNYSDFLRTHKKDKL